MGDWQQISIVEYDYKRNWFIIVVNLVPRIRERVRGTRELMNQFIAQDWLISKMRIANAKRF